MSHYFSDLPPQFRASHWHGDVMVVKLTKSFRANTSKGPITVPRDFYSDGLSIPRICWTLVGPSTGRGFAAGLVHDFLYSKESDDFYNFARKVADDLFLESLHALGVSWPQRHAMHLAVRGAGWKSYKKR